MAGLMSDDVELEHETWHHSWQIIDIVRKSDFAGEGQRAGLGAANLRLGGYPGAGGAMRRWHDAQVGGGTLGGRRCLAGGAGC